MYLAEKDCGDDLQCDFSSYADALWWGVVGFTLNYDHSSEESNIPLPFSDQQDILTYLIFVRNAGNAVSAKFLAECKKIQKTRENYCFGLRLS